MKHVILGGLLALLPVLANAQGSGDDSYDEIDAALAESMEAGTRDPDADKDDLPEIGEDQLAVFVLDRGFYLASDLGVFFTLGGGIKNGPSNLQPFVAVKVGYDFIDWFGAETTLSTSYVSGNPASKADRPGNVPGGEVSNFSLFNWGVVQAVFAIRPTDRFAIEPRVGVGISVISPSLTKPNDPQGDGVSIAFHVAPGIDFKYLTLLTDFSAGLAINTFLIFPGEDIGMLFAIGPAVNVRYTF